MPDASVTSVLRKIGERRASPSAASPSPIGPSASRSAPVLSSPSTPGSAKSEYGAKAARFLHRGTGAWRLGGVGPGGLGGQGGLR
eukprot:945947-Prymnesium_polylepis.2